ncbi:MAG: MgtC/SapB family protein [Phycisphaerae bacterium]|nr:MgtC/SapB family protein [Phycisphaerae bacterium]
MELDWIDVIKLLAAIGGGALIGLERELAAKPAGLRTNILICLGAALFTVLSIKVAEAGDLADRGRIAAQIVTGVGFLGAGAIIQHRRYVVGLTTAATIWADASVGMAFGAGEFALGILGAVLTSGVLFGLGLAEARIAHWHTVARFEVEMDISANITDVIERLANETGVRWKSWSVNKTPDSLVGRFKAVGPISNLKDFQRALLHEEQIAAAKRL